MAEKILVSPGDIRGKGNIVIPHSTGDYIRESSSVTSSDSESIENLEHQVNVLGYLPGGHFVVTTGEFVEYTSGLTSFDCDVTLLYYTGAGISSADVTCKVNKDTTLTGVTDGSGNVSFTIPITEGVSTYLLELSYAGSEYVSGCQGFHHVFVGGLNDIELDVTPVTLLGDGEQTHLLATVTGTDILGAECGVPGQLVTFYEAYTPEIRVNADYPVITSGETSKVTARIVDTEDGSIVPTDGTLYYFIDIDWTPVATTVDLISTESVLSQGNNYSTVLYAKVVDQKGLAMIGETVTFKKGGTTLGTATTDIQGRASYTYTDNLSTGTITLSAECGSASDSVTVDSDNVVDTITLNVDHDTISLGGTGLESSATISATVFNQNDVPLPGETVAIKQDGVTVATKTSNSSGVVSYTYNANGDGDIVFTFECGSVSDDITIEDLIYYFQGTSIQSTATDEFVGFIGDVSLALPTNCEISFDMKSTIEGLRLFFGSPSQIGNKVANYSFGANFRSTGIGAYYRTTTASQWGNDITKDTNWHSFKFVKTGTSVEAFVDSSSHGSQIFSWIDDYSNYTWGVWSWNTGQGDMKDIKVKKVS